jgi:Right handed beta helix region
MVDVHPVVGAAFIRLLMRVGLLAALAAVLFAHAPQTATAALPRELWAVKPITLQAQPLRSLRGRGINAIVVTRLTAAQRPRVRAAKLVVLPRRGVRVVALAGPRSVLRLQAPRAKIRVLALVRLTNVSDDPVAWEGAVSRAASKAWLDLGVAPKGPNRIRAFHNYLQLMRRVRRQGLDPPPPPAPAPPPGLGRALPAALPPSAGTTFHVATSGSDSDPGTATHPWRTIQKALSTLAAGQRALVRGGTYAENLRMTRAGSPLAPITVEAYPGERPVLTAAGSHPLEVASSGAYFRFRGFVIERAPGNSGGNVDIYGHHVELSGNEIRHSQDQGVYTDERSHHAHILGNLIHHNGQGVIHQSHGIYLQGDDHLVASNVIHDHVKGFGIQVYDRGSRAIVTGNTITGAGHSGIVVGGSGGVANVRVHNNVFAFNAHYGISHDSSCPSSSAANHNVVFGNAWGATQAGCSGLSYAGGNRTTDPLFRSYGFRDLRLLAGSPALDYALVEYSATTDFDGLMRTYGAGPDAGAFEHP